MKAKQVKNCPGCRGNWIDSAGDMFCSVKCARKKGRTLRGSVLKPFAPKSRFKPKFKFPPED